MWQGRALENSPPGPTEDQGPCVTPPFAINIEDGGLLMIKRCLSALALSLAALGCSHSPKHEAPPAAAPVAQAPAVPAYVTAKRAPAAEELFWFEHPCGVKGAPFRKYHSFSYDTYSGQLYGRKSEQSQPELIKNKPKGRVVYDGVYDFFGDAGILKFCQSAGVGPGAPTPPEPGEGKPQPPAGGTTGGSQPPPAGPVRGFVPPIQEKVDLYYANVQRDLQQEADTGRVKALLQKHMTSPRLQRADSEDRVVEACPSRLEQGEVCVSQIDFGPSEEKAYDRGREIMMGEMDLGQDGSEYQIYDYYCQSWQKKKDFEDAGSSSAPGPGRRIGGDHLVNTEHTWPKDRFVADKGTHEYSRQVSDVHHLLTTDTKANALRSNYEFAEVDPQSAKVAKCVEDNTGGRPDGNGDVLFGGMLGSPVPVAGTTAQGDKYFEPPRGVKGQLARMQFYFATRYNAGMSTLQEYYLRQWHKEYPPTDEERKRNEIAYRRTGLRNIFVDMPEVVDRVKRFCRIKGGLNDGLGKPHTKVHYCTE